MHKIKLECYKEKNGMEKIKVKLTHLFMFYSCFIRKTCQKINFVKLREKNT